MSQPPRKKSWTEEPLPPHIRENMDRIFNNSILSETLENIDRLSKQLTHPISEITRAIEQIHESLHPKEIEDFASRFADLHSNILGNWGRVIRAYEFLNPAISDEELIDLSKDSELAKKEIVRETIIAIGVEATKRMEKQLPKRKFRIGASHKLYDQENKQLYIDLSDLMFKLFINLRKQSTQTTRLARLSGYKNNETARRGIQRINGLGYTKLNLAGSLVIGDKDLGYRLAKFVSIKK